MKRNTKDLLIESAMQEFMECGYKKSSVRRICEKAGVTTGALYFFFKDKDDLLSCVVNGPLTKFEEIIGNHFEKIDISFLIEELISLYYRYQEEFTILLHRSEGSAYENVVDRIVELLELKNGELAERLKGIKADPFIIHWISHEQISAFLNLTEHCKSEDEALIKAKTLQKYLTAGWRAAIS